jgi:hypothetical protein
VTSRFDLRHQLVHAAIVAAGHAHLPELLERRGLLALVVELLRLGEEAASTSVARSPT